MAIEEKQQKVTLSIITILILFVLAAASIYKLVNSPDVVFLTNKKQTQWIKLSRNSRLIAKEPRLREIAFAHRFETVSKIKNAEINVQALKQFRLIIDGKQIYDSPKNLDMWKQTYDVKIPFDIMPGKHDLTIVVTAKDSPAALWAYSRQLNLKTGPHWRASANGSDWVATVPASYIKPAEISREFPNTIEALRTVAPWLAVVFIIVFAWTMLYDHFKERSKYLWYPKPEHFRWTLLILWVLMAANNIFKINFQMGYDIRAHIEYIHYVATNRTLPLATDGWQMFQSPLYYILNAPLYTLLNKWFELELVVKCLRLIPLACGLIQIEIVYRVAKLVFPKKHALQSVAVLVGALMPVHIYICQFVSNEPFAGCLVSIVILLVISLLTVKDAKRQPAFFILLGFIWGLALLTKVTPILLAPMLLITIIIYGISNLESGKRIILNISLVFGTSFAIASWYYIRNYIRLGKPFVGGWDPSTRFIWWQDPGYRTWSQILSFGEALIHPIYAGVVSFLDAIYSTLWLDGFTSGIASFKDSPPWNYNFLSAGALLAIIPTTLIFLAVIALFRKDMIYAKKAILFSFACIALYLATMLFLYIKLPVYSTAKASYAVGLLPCFAVLAAAGTQPLLKAKFLKTLIFASLACWAVAAFVAYFT